MNTGKAACIFFIAFWQISLLCLQAQMRVAPDRYRVEFVDKNHSAYTVCQPQDFLSERALQRRARQGVAVTRDDLPVSALYLDSLKKLGVEVLNTSRWFNSATVRCSPEALEKLKQLDFVRNTPLQKEIWQNEADEKDELSENLFSFLFRLRNEREIDAKYDALARYYGEAAAQVGMMNGQALHERGFRGKGMLIAVIDGGFFKAMELSGFDNLRNSGRLREIKNFTSDMDDNTEGSSHGTNVLSILASELPGRMMGAAPDAEYVLLHSEEIATEYIVEEDNWIAAVEYADSIGADMVTSSLGYTTFDDVSQNHSYRDLDGKTVRTSRAATMAAARGMIVCVSAGNDGDSRWKYISVPADADSVVTVGAVDRDGQYVSFSSKGYTFDGRIKPDLTAMGRETAYQNSMGVVNTGSGTSYSTPLVTGMIACLWQAFPEKGNMEIIDMVKRSASRFHEPDTLYGYGIPDFAKLIRSSTLPPVAKNDSYAVSVHPEPNSDKFTVFLSPAQHRRVHIRIKTPSGRQVFSHSGFVSGYDKYEWRVGDSEKFDAGLYLVEVRTDAGAVTAKKMF